MKAYVLLVFYLIIAASCSTDVDLAADWEETTIVMGLLDASDSVQYVKINKAFLDKSVSALTLAQRSDSLYHKNISVTLDEKVNGRIQNTYTLTKVDANQELGMKEEGIFANDPNFLYKLTEPLQEDAIYQLNIENAGSVTVTAETPIVKNIQVLKPQTTSTVNWSAENVRHTWRKPENGVSVDLTIYIHYLEKTSDGTITSKTITWNAFKTNTGDQKDIDGIDFYNQIKTNVSENASVTRQIVDHDYVFTVAGQEIYNYIIVNNAQSGITETQITPNYSNVNNGLGIFSSKYTEVVKGVLFHPRALDSLINGSVTSHLNFAKKI